MYDDYAKWVVRNCTVRKRSQRVREAPRQTALKPRSPFEPSPCRLRPSSTVFRTPSGLLSLTRIVARDVAPAPWGRICTSSKAKYVIKSKAIHGQETPQMGVYNVCVVWRIWICIQFITCLVGAKARIFTCSSTLNAP